MFATSSHLFAANYTISVNTNCSTIGGAGVPLAAADNVTIRSGATLTVDGTYSCSNLTVSSNATAGTVKMNAGSQLTCTGTLDMGGTGATAFGTLDMTLGGKFIMAGNLLVRGSAPQCRLKRLAMPHA